MNTHKIVKNVSIVEVLHVGLAESIFSLLIPSEVNSNETVSRIEHIHTNLSFPKCTQPKASLGEFLKHKRRKLDEISLENQLSFLQEFNFYEKSNTRSERLELLYNALCSIKATSVESERSFSGLGRFLTKFRSRLSDRYLNYLLVLRHYFLNE